MNTMAGAFDLACSNSLRTRDAPTPTKTSMNSDPLAEKNGTPGFAGDRAREQRLAGAGRPDEQRAFRHARAERRELRRAAQKLDDFLELFLGFVDAGDRVEAGLCGALFDRARGRPRVSAVIDFTGFMRLYDMPRIDDEARGRR